jgi:gamma-glutamyltranspeptidase / glutathione hydrolase
MSKSRILGTLWSSRFTTTSIALAPAVFLSIAAEGAQRPPVMGPNAAVSAGDPLTTAAAFEILASGGNAFDAGVAALLVGGVIEQDLYGLGGEALILVYANPDSVMEWPAWTAATRRQCARPVGEPRRCPDNPGEVVSVVGQGWAPRGATIEWYEERGKDLEGEGLDPAVIPGALHGALTVLELWGTMSFEEVSARAIEYAELGFPLRPRTADSIEGNLDFFEAWPDNQRYWLKPDGSLYEPGETIKLPTLARTLTRMLEAEQAAADGGREAGIRAARDRFYKGDIAEEMVAFLQEHGTPFELDDFSQFYAKIEEPTMVTYGEYEVYKQSFGSQGPVLLQTLNILENFDLQAMGHNSADYVHTVVEAMKLAYADRDTYYADPEFVQVPGEGLLSKEYAAERAQLIDPERASTDFVAGDPLPYDSEVDEWEYWVANIADGNDPGQPPPNPEPIRGTSTDQSSGAVKDTTHITIIDKDGNVFDSTPSGGWIGGGVILGDTGIAMSTRGEQFWLDETRAAQLRPRSRPRYTLTPSLVLRDGEPFMAIGTPGGDNQDQTILQSFLAIVEFWPDWFPNLHDAIEWPRVSTSHMFGSFWPHSTGFNQLEVESPLGDEVIEDLQNRGHDLEVSEPFGVSGCSTVALIDPASDNRIAGADPRRYCYALAH